jgi:hypothetical protein
MPAFDERSRRTTSSSLRIVLEPASCRAATAA